MKSTVPSSPSHCCLHVSLYPETDFSPGLVGVTPSSPVGTFSRFRVLQRVLVVQRTHRDGALFLRKCRDSGWGRSPPLEGGRHHCELDDGTKGTIQPCRPPRGTFRAPRLGTGRRYPALLMCLQNLFAASPIPLQVALLTPNPSPLSLRELWQRLDWLRELGGHKNPRNPRSASLSFRCKTSPIRVMARRSLA